MRRSTQTKEPRTKFTVDIPTVTVERVDAVAARELRSRSAQIAKFLEEATRDAEARRAE